MRKLILRTVALCLLTCFAAFGVFAQKKVWDYSKETPLADLRVRQALAYAIDMETITQTLFEGQVTPALSLTNVGPWQSSNLVKYGYNPAKAKELLAAARWPADYTLDVVTYYPDQQTADFLTVVQDYLGKVGIKMKWRLLEGDIGVQVNTPPADRVNGPSAVKWDLAYVAAAAPVESGFYTFFGSTSPTNSHTPSDAIMDKLLEALNVADIPSQMKAIKAVQERVNEKVYAIPLYHLPAFIYVNNLLDTKGTVHGNDQFSYEKNILDWVINRADKTMYTNWGPKEFYDVPTVNPGLAAFNELIFDKLVNADSNLAPTTGMLAKSYTISPDGMRFDFDLRTDVKWHDGKPFTAEDVKFTFEFYARAPGFSSTTFRRIKGGEDFVAKKTADIAGIAINGSKVTVTFEKVAPDAAMVFSQWPILPKHLLSDCDPLTAQTHKFWQNPIGTGPFMAGEFVRNTYAVLVRNPNYYKKGSGNIQKIFMSASNDNDPNLVLNAEAGKIDYSWSKSTADAKAIGKLPNFKVTKAPIRYTRYFLINKFPHLPNVK